MKYNDNGTYKDIYVKTFDTLPVGAVIGYPSTNIPDNWLLCDGRAVSRTTYAQLFEKIGTAYGSGDGSTTFNLPDYKGKTPVGLDSNDTDFDTIGKTGGEKTHTLTINEMPSHTHVGKEYGYGNRSWNLQPGRNVLSHKSNIPTATEHTYENVTNAYLFNGAESHSTGGGQAHNIVQPYAVQCFIIKAYGYIESGASLSNTYGTSNENGYTQEYINNLETYSTTEKRVGTWEKSDGTIVPLYRRIWYQTISSTDTYPLYVDVGMNGSFMTKVDVSLTTSNNVKAPLPYYLASNNYGIWNTNLNRIIYDAKGTFFTDGTLTIIIEYIK